MITSGALLTLFAARSTAGFAPWRRERVPSAPVEGRPVGLAGDVPSTGSTLSQDDEVPDHHSSFLTTSIAEDQGATKQARHNYKPPLRTEGKLIVDKNGRPVLLKGANLVTHGRSGTEGLLMYMPLQHVLDEFVEWGFNSVRLNYSLDQLFADSKSPFASTEDDDEYDCNKNLLICENKARDKDYLKIALHFNKGLYEKCAGAGRRGVVSAGGKSTVHWKLLQRCCDRFPNVDKKKIEDDLAWYLQHKHDMQCEDQELENGGKEMTFAYLKDSWQFWDTLKEWRKTEQKWLKRNKYVSPALVKRCQEAYPHVPERVIKAALLRYLTRQWREEDGNGGEDIKLAKLQETKYFRKALERWGSYQEPDRANEDEEQVHRSYVRLHMNYVQVDREQEETGLTRQPNEDEQRLLDWQPASRSLPLCLLDEMVLEITKRKLFVILNNHVSQAGWCCEPWDDNGMWFTEKYPTGLFLRHISFLADRYKDNKYVIGIDLRNEVRPMDFPKPPGGNIQPVWNTEPKPLPPPPSPEPSPPPSPPNGSGAVSTSATSEPPCCDSCASCSSFLTVVDEQAKFVEPAFFSKEPNWLPVAEASARRMEEVGAKHMLVIVEGLFMLPPPHPYVELPREPIEQYNLHGRFPGRIVYSVHEYGFTHSGWRFDRAHLKENTPGGKDEKDEGYVPSYGEYREALEKHWGKFSDDYPVWVGEFGFNVEEWRDSIFFLYIQRYLAEKRLHWCWWQTAPVREWTQNEEQKQQKKAQKACEGYGLVDTMTRSKPSQRFVPYPLRERSHTKPDATEVMNKMRNIVPVHSFEQYARDDEETWVQKGLMEDEDNKAYATCRSKIDELGL